MPVERGACRSEPEDVVRLAEPCPQPRRRRGVAELIVNDVGKERSTVCGVLAMFAKADPVALHYGGPPTSRPAGSRS